MLYYTLIIIFFALPSLAKILRNLFADLYFWQIKEYRLDRVKSALRYEHLIDRKNILTLIIRLVLLAGSILYLILQTNQFWFLFIVIAFAISIFEMEDFLRLLIRKQLLRPSLKSLRNILIIGFSTLIILLPYFFLTLWVNSLNYETNDSSNLPAVLELKPLQYSTDVSFTEILPQKTDGLLVFPLATLLLVLVTILNLSLEICTNIIVSVFVAFTSPLSFFRRKALIIKAKKALLKAKNLKVIGITGSYGKTTTKELLFQVLEKNFNVVKTPENKNTAVGIAQTISKSIKPDTNIFIAEMGAYRKGEIKDATNLVAPDISIVTGIESQHITLFGGLEKLIQAKFEIVDGLKSDGLAIFNGDNEYCVQMASHTKQRKILYFTINDELKMTTSSVDESKSDEKKMYKFPHNENVYAKGISSDTTGIKFILSFLGKEYPVKTNITGKHNVLNLLAVIVAAGEVGLGIEEIVKIINSTKFEFPYLNKYTGINNSIILDDGYNISFSGFLAGLEFLQQHSEYKKKWVLTQGIIELGEEKPAVYDKIAEMIVLTAEGLITTDAMLAGKVRELEAQTSELETGNSKIEVIEVTNPQEFVKAYSENVKEGEIVLVEGSLPEEVGRKLKIKN